MKIFGWHKQKYRFFGIPILRIKNINENSYYYLFSIKIYKESCILTKIQHEFQKHKSFDTRSFDKKITQYLTNLPPRTEETSHMKQNHIAFLASEIYDSGGHTECIKNLASSFPKEFESKLFLTRFENSTQNAPHKIDQISKYTEIEHANLTINSLKRGNLSLVMILVKKIIDFEPQTLISFIHMDDSLGACILAYIKKHTDIHIIFWNHGSHYPTLGMSFADIILEGGETMAQITQKQRGFNNTYTYGLCYLKEKDIPVFTESQMAKQKEKFGLPSNAICTMSGGAPYKFFDGDKSSYFEMIYRLLRNNTNLYHVIISRFSDSEQKTIEQIFKDTTIKERLIITDLTANYRLYFKCADLFIDSFPVSSALTQIDLMSLKVPTLVKINKDDPKLSFHEYLPNNYPYMSESIESFERMAQFLINNKKERVRIAEHNYNFFLETYEGTVAAKKILNLIDSIAYKK